MRKIELISLDNKYETKRIFNEYLNELYKFDPTIEFDNNGEPIYNWFDYYWIEKERFPLSLNIDNKFAGLALVRELGENKYEIAEFYILPEFRKDGNAMWFASQILKSFKGDFVFSTRLENLRAIKFWNKVADSVGFSETEVEDGYKVWKIKQQKKVKKNDVETKEK